METDFNDEGHLNALERICSFGIIGCLLFSTWELNHLMADEWFANWVKTNEFVYRRLILYGTAALIAAASLFWAVRNSLTKNRFLKTLNVSFLWFGTILLISTIAFFVFDCLPEVFAGIIGALVFIFCIFVIQRKFYTPDRVAKTRLRKSLCRSCGEKLAPASLYCPSCGATAGKTCPSCNFYSLITDRFCSHCRREYT